MIHAVVAFIRVIAIRISHSVSAAVTPHVLGKALSAGIGIGAMGGAAGYEVARGRRKRSIFLGKKIYVIKKRGGAAQRISVRKLNRQLPTT